MNRSRPRYVLALAGVVAFGLASRRFPIFPVALGKYPGDALWALMAFVGWGVVFPSAPSWKIAAAALGTAWAVELSQLYQAAWIRSIRATTLGRLALGTGFVPGDLVAYAVGAGAGWCGERWRAWSAVSQRTSARDGNWTGWAERRSEAEFWQWIGLLWFLPLVLPSTSAWLQRVMDPLPALTWGLGCLACFAIAEWRLGDCPACRARSGQKWNHDACKVCGRGPSGG